MRRRRWSEKMKGRAVVAVGTLVFAACTGAQAGEVSVDAAAETTTSDAVSTTTLPQTTTTDPPAETATSTTTQAEPENGVRAGEVVMGEIALDMLEPTIALKASDPWDVTVAVPGAVVLQDPDMVSQYTRAVLFLEARPFAATIDEWAAGNDGATIESRKETQVGGLDAVVYDVTYSGDREQLAMLTAKCCGGSIVVRATEHYRLWMIETAGDPPLTLVAPVLLDDLDWLDEAEILVSTVEFVDYEG